MSDEHLVQLIADRNGFREQLSRVAERLGLPGYRGVIGGPITVLEQTASVVEAVDSLASNYRDLMEECDRQATLQADELQRLRNGFAWLAIILRNEFSVASDRHVLQWLNEVVEEQGLQAWEEWALELPEEAGHEIGGATG